MHRLLTLLVRAAPLLLLLPPMLADHCGIFMPGDACEPNMHDSTIGSNMTAQACHAACEQRAGNRSGGGCCWYGPGTRQCQWNTGGRAAPAGRRSRAVDLFCTMQVIF